MLTAETKRHIDAARQVLVGVVPNPAAQIDQITNALIYKFMDDMDQSAVRAGDKPSFFVGELERYAWTRVMDTRLGNQERMNLYAEALVKFSTSQKLPELFRDIFRQAYLPFRSPDVLYLFLKEIDYFGYSHSEELGNAYEYLLSILSAQGDAGQFRTPRHVIDFIVDVVDPTPDDTVLDPACGTAGFLISAYKHILEKHTEVDKKTGKTKSTLTPIQRQKIMKNFEGYDISPEMVKLSRVNMYLHHFKNPKIYEYDTLSREERWNDKFSVILANPPFMSPKGGIKPHSRFSIQSSRSEVLFVDYFIEHLKQPNGRAGMIVPEGIIFQSGSAHRQIRENLIKDGLYAVVSLPAGVFNPYSGVKTSILFFDNAVVKKTKKILFVKVENDGYSLGAQRRPIGQNDLTDALNVLQAWRGHILKGSPLLENPIATAVEREEVTKTNDLNLSADYYKKTPVRKVGNWQMVTLDKVATFVRGVTFDKSDQKEIGKMILRASNISLEGKITFEDVIYVADSVKTKPEQVVIKGDILICMASGSLDHVGKVAIASHDLEAFVGGFIGKLVAKNVIIPEFLFEILNSEYVQEQIKKTASGININNLSWKKLAEIQVPLPPVEIQKVIVSEARDYRRIIDGSRKVVVSWKPRIEFNSSWAIKKIGDLVDTITPPKKIQKSEYKSEGTYPVIDQSQNDIAGWTDDESTLINISTPAVIFGDHTCVVKFLERPFAQGADGIKILKTRESILPKYLFYSLLANPLVPSGYKRHFADLQRKEIPLPSTDIQLEIVKQIDIENGFIENNKKLIALYESRIKDLVAGLWNK